MIEGNVPKETDGVSKENKKLIATKVIQNFSNYLPYIVFLLVPFFAFLLFSLFYKRKKYYANHMIFALHFHSFVFLLFTLFTLVSEFVPDSWDGTVSWIMGLLPAVYLSIALYVAYRPTLLKLLWKIPFIMLVYALVCLTVLVLFVLLLIRIVGIMHDIPTF